MKTYITDYKKQIRCLTDAVDYLFKNNECLDILDVLTKLPIESYEWKIAAWRAVVAACTNNIQRDMIEGEVWYPSIELCDEGKEKNCWGDTVVGQIKYNSKIFSVVGNAADKGTGGLSGIEFDGYSSMAIRSVPTKELAEYLSLQFGKLLFEICYQGVNCNWEWV